MTLIMAEVMLLCLSSPLTTSEQLYSALFCPAGGLVFLASPYHPPFTVIKECIRSAFGLYFSLISTNFIQYVKPHVAYTDLYIVSVLSHVGVLLRFRVLLLVCVV